MRKALLGGLLLAAAAMATASQEQQTRAQALESRLLAPCCFREPVSRHQSEAAVKMRAEISRLVAAGKTDEEILSGYTERYGSQVIATFAPTPGWAPWVPWGLGLLATAGLTWWLARLARRTGRISADASGSPLGRTH